jgi:hypothetical protein
MACVTGVVSMALLTGVTCVADVVPVALMPRLHPVPLVLGGVHLLAVFHEHLYTP